MIINHQYKFIFFRTRKTASTSMAIALSKFCGAGDTITPLPEVDEAIRRKLGHPGPRNYAIPTRHYRRFDWLVSLREMQRRTYPRHATAALVKRTVDPEVWNTYFKFCFERNPFDKAISRYFWTAQNPRPEIHDFLNGLETTFLTNWDVYTINDHVALDFVGRYENLSDDLKTIGERIGLPEAIHMPKAKSQHRKNKDHYSTFLNEEARRRVEVVCAKEIAMFDYGWKEEDAE